MRSAFIVAALLAMTAQPQSLMLDTCVQCHDFHWITAQHKTEDAWRRTVNEMIWRGAPLEPGEADVIVKYLAGNVIPSREDGEESGRRGSRPPDSSRSSALGMTLPPGTGRDLVIAQCIQCHDLTVTTSQHKSLAEWRRSVDEMVRLGAKLNGAESQTVARYLAHAFGIDR